MSVRLHSPIVLAHGLFGYKQIGLGPLTISSYFRGIPEWLAAAGNRVYVTQVPPIAGVASRAARLGEQITAAFPDEPVHLIGHSLGGLDARALLTDPGWSARVLSLTTIGTPHLGSAIADFARMRFGRIYRQLSHLGVDHRGFYDVTRRAARGFHLRTVPPESVRCFSVAGAPAPDQVCWPFRRLYTALLELEGPNDGLVSVESATAFGVALPLSPLDHLRQMNWLVPDGSPDSATAFGMYSMILENLAQHGFAASRESDSLVGSAQS